MLVAKRKKEGHNISYQPIDFEKIHWRIKSMCTTPNVLEFQKSQRPEDYSLFQKLPPLYHANVDLISKKTIEGVYDKIPTTEIDKLSAEIAQEMCVSHPDNSTLATRILVSNLQKNIVETMLEIFNSVKSDAINSVKSGPFPYDRTEITTNLFKYVMKSLYMNLDKHGERSPLIAPYLAAIAEKYSDKINSILDLSRDYINHDYLGIKTLEKSYLFRINSLQGISEKNFVVESPSISDMRIAIALVCSPSPCPTYYENFSEFLELHPEIIKSKYRNETITDHEDKRIDRKLFKGLYWDFLLDKYLTGLNQNDKFSNIQISDQDWIRIKNIYDGMSQGRFTPATPTRFSAGTLKPQGSSCFLIAMENDSLSGIYNTLKEQSQISKHAGGVGIHVHNIRSTGSYIAGTNGISNGLKPMIQLFNASAVYVDQGGGRRPGSIAIYLEPWHPDIIDFIRLKRKKGAETDRAKRLFYALWVPDEFFRCWKENKDWHLFDPSVCPKLYDSYDEKFSENYLSDEFVQNNKKDYLFTYRYRKYIKQKKYEKIISPELIMEELVETVKHEGVPYFLCKDSANRKSNQKNIGVIKSSNLCTEIIQYSDENQTAVCNLHSICISKFVRPFQEGDNEKFKYDISLNDTPNYWTFDFGEFAKTVVIAQNNIDRLIELNYYPSEKARNSNIKTKSQGLGIQGESDLMAFLKIPWNSKRANELRFYIFERMYYECLQASVELAKVYGVYEYFEGSPAARGILQHDMWRNEGKKISFELSLDWDTLKKGIQKHGLRNSLFIAPMPTASTSDIMGNSPSIEPFNSLIYVRSAGAGNVTIINKGLVNDLMSIGMWNKKMSDKILANHGSIKDIIEIPKKLRDAYLTVYDLEPSDIIDAAYSRSFFVCQSQSMNLFFRNVTMAELSKAWTRGWKRGLKTLSYYCRTRPATNAQKAQISLDIIPEKNKEEGPVCSRENPDCLSCGS
jgi:ribonucleoside-diphosphate reductase alpha chain